jgi:hypothetical protein
MEDDLNFWAKWMNTSLYSLFFYFYLFAKRFFFFNLSVCMYCSQGTTYYLKMLAKVQKCTKYAHTEKMHYLTLAGWTWAGNSITIDYIQI